MNEDNDNAREITYPLNISKIPEDEINRRINAIQQAMQEKEIGGLMIVQRTDMFYFSGTSQSGYLYIPAQGAPALFIRKYMPRAQEESPIRQKIQINSVRQLPGLITDIYGKLPDVMGFEWDVMPVREFNYLKELLNPKKYVDGSSLILKTRMIKSNWEITQMEQTAQISSKVFQYIPTVIQPGLTELELSGIYEAYARKIGHSSAIRVRDYKAEIHNWHVLSGESGGMVGFLDAPATGHGTSAAFPCSASYKKLKYNEPVMIDLGTVSNGYHMDETRMFSIGPMPDQAYNACRAVIDIHNAIIEKAKPGMTMNQLYQDAVDMAASSGYAEEFLGPSGSKVTFIGHGVGIEMVEPPFIAMGKTERLEPGMTFALEPKMVFQDRFSAGIESVFTVTESGSRLLSLVPADIFIC